MKDIICNTHYAPTYHYRSVKHYRKGGYLSSWTSRMCEYRDYNHMLHPPVLLTEEEAQELIDAARGDGVMDSNQPAKSGESMKCPE